MKIIQVLDFIQNNIRSNFLDAIMPVISLIGNNGGIWIAVALIFIAVKKHRIDGHAILSALFMGFLICNVSLKPLVARIRPCDVNTAIELLISRPNDYSFPSGHTVSSFAAATVIFLRNKHIGIAAIILACLIAFSRLYLYVHYPSDILVGILIGIVIGVFIRFAQDKIIKVKKTTKNE